jgi:hypothetical protein
MRIVETDNFNGDYPKEKFVNLPQMTKRHAQEVCDAINVGWMQDHDRYWKVVENDYQLQPGFEP